MSDSYVSNSYNAETDGKMSQDAATYTNKDGNTVYAVANYKELDNAFSQNNMIAKPL